MDMIQTDKLVFEYDKRDEDGNIIGKSRAIDEVDIDVKVFPFHLLNPQRRRKC